MNKKYRTVTLGCRTNQYESAAYQNQLKKMGWQEAKEDEEADVCIINTCTVTAQAHKDSKLAVQKQVRTNPNAKVIVTGCAVEKEEEFFQQMASVVPNLEKEMLLKPLFEENLPEFSINCFDAHTRAFVKVQDGCNSFCTYCIIPYVRGRSRSRSIADVVREVETLVANGYKEVVLTGINIGDFDGGQDERLATLVRRVDQVKGLKRLRLSSIDADEVDDDLMDAILSGTHTANSLHMVLQSGSNVMLKKMNRKYTRQIFLDTAEKLRKADPGFTFTTDVIVGFPGESQEDFEETLAVIQEVKFAKVHMFPYSPRERTRAFHYPRRIPSEVMKERKQALMRHAEQVAFSLRQEFVGETKTLLVESFDGVYSYGHTENFLPVAVQEKLASNSLVAVKLMRNDPARLQGVFL